ncbi:MAG: nucleoside hydrolase [Firmicutes bacterium]|nr:nucleoside hydrolase [Bacillota bacterium]
MKYIIDTDPGIDDAIAIMLAIRNNLDVIGFTLASGNIPIEKSENNLKIIEDFMVTNIPIYKGSIINDAKETAEYAHGKDGLGYAVFPKNITRRTEKMSAEDFIIKASKKYKDNLMVICLGPLTNLANAIKKDATLPQRLKKILVMSATYNPESTKAYKEFNITVDPMAAKIVYESPFEEIKAITHEAGVKAFIEKDYIQNLKHSDDTISRLVSQIGEKYIEFSYDHYKTIGLGTPDPLTIASIIDKDIITFEPFNVEIITEGDAKGESYATPANKSNIYLSTAFDLDRFRTLFKNTFK